MMKNTLIFLPEWNTTHPYLSLPCLAGYLRSKDVNIDQIDLNIEWFWYINSIEFINSCRERICRKNLKEDDVLLYKIIYSYLLENNELYKSIIKDKEKFYEYEGYKKIKNYTEMAQLFISEAYDGLKIDTNMFSSDSSYDIDELYLKACDDTNNPFIKFYKKMIKKYNLLEYDFIGFSLIGMGQLSSLFAIIRILREEGSKAHVCLGGNTFSKIHYKIEENKNVFNFVDSILFFEGEYPLFKLIKTLENNESLENVPNCAFYDKEKDKVVITEIAKCIVPIEELPTPDYSGLLLDLYTAPHRILPYFVSRSCYWGRCAFCDHDYGYDGVYRVKSIDKVFEDIRVLKERFDADVIYFVDEALSVPFIEKLCDRMDENNSFKWFAYIKASTKFTYELCKKMHDCGCLFIMVGIESCSSTVLESMNKGITTEDIYATVENMNKAGIWLHSFLINDFPTETKEDKLETLFSIFEYNFHSNGLSEFSLPKHSKMYSNLEEYGIYETKENSKLSSILSYKSKIKCNKKLQRRLINLYNTKVHNNFVVNTLMDSQHIPLFMMKYDLILNNDILYKLVRNEYTFDKNDLIYYKKDNSIIIFNIYTNKMLEIPSDFGNIIERCERIEVSKLRGIIKEEYSDDKYDIEEVLRIFNIIFK